MLIVPEKPQSAPVLAHAYPNHVDPSRAGFTEAGELLFIQPGPGVVCRFVSWDLHVIWPDYSVDGLPGMVEQSGKLPVVMKLPLS